MNRFDVPADHCISCGRHLNGAQSLRCEEARPGDVTICMYCGMLMQFGPDMKLQRISEEILVEVKKSALWQEIVELQRRLNRLMDYRAPGDPSPTE